MNFKEILENLKVGESVEIMVKSPKIGRYCKGIRVATKKPSYFSTKVPHIPINLPQSMPQILYGYRLATNLDRILLGNNLPESQ